jgi:phosphohistidine phosphatase
MFLYLMRHGEALAASEDPERPLSPAGVAQVQASAAALRRLGILPDFIAASPKRRARQTAALVAEAVNFPYSDIAVTSNLKPEADPADALAWLRKENRGRTLLLVGHLPQLPQLAALLMGGDVQLRLGTAGLCVIAVDDFIPGGGELHCLLTASQLQLLAP